MNMKKDRDMALTVMTANGIIEENHLMTLKVEADQGAQSMTTETGIVTEDIIEVEIGIETIIDLGEDQEATNLDGKERRGRVVTGTDIVTMIGTVIGIGFSEWL